MPPVLRVPHRKLLIKLALVAIGWGALAAGCDRPAPFAADSGGAEKPASATADKSATVSGDARYHQSFAEATRQEPPAGFQLQPCRSYHDREVDRQALRAELVALWPSIELLGPDGKPLSFGP